MTFKEIKNPKDVIVEKIKQKVETKLKEIFEEDNLDEINLEWCQNDIDHYIFCKISVDFIDNEQFRELYQRFKQRKYEISISPDIYDDDDPPIIPYIEIEIQPIKLMDLEEKEDVDIQTQ